MAADKNVTVLIVEDQELVRLGVRFMLERFPEITIVGEAVDGEGAVATAASLAPAVVLMDIGLPKLDGIGATKQIKANTEAKVIMLTSRDDTDEVFAALSSGADGYCLKNVSPEQLVRAIFSVAEGAGWLDPGVAAHVLRGASERPKPREQSTSKFALSAREMEVLQLLVEGLSNQGIAERLIVSAETVKTHVRHIMEKMLVSDRTQAAVKAIREKVI